MTSAEFEVDIPADSPQAFASLSGDWNPLHTDPEYAAGTRFRRPLLHGAFMAGLVSRMAGMHLPGTACLLHSMRLRFNAPVQPPVRVVVRGEVVVDDGEAGRAEVTIEDATSGTVYAGASYEFSRHEHAAEAATADQSDHVQVPSPDGPAPVLVTGASGGLGAAVMEVLGSRAVGLSRRSGLGLLHVPELEAIGGADLPTQIDGIVHCAWPMPDNQRLLDLPRPDAAVEHHVASPLRQIFALARFLEERGTPGAMLVLVGSTFADPGRHNYRMPLYTLAKGVLPSLTRVLALELANADRRCVSVTFDVIDGGMNEGLNARARIQNTDRSPFGRLPTPADAAEQIGWVVQNRGFLASGATLSLTGGTIP
jgi:NAD(P)-dependent dehydrogenase (short-subunit alcohol dehydrogenase family)/acyl dehydratase